MMLVISTVSVASAAGPASKLLRYGTTKTGAQLSARDVDCRKRVSAGETASSDGHGLVDVQSVSMGLAVCGARTALTIDPPDVAIAEVMDAKGARAPPARTA